MARTGTFLILSLCIAALTAACGGTTGTFTVDKFVTEPKGSHCASGGVAILSGVDSNANGALDDSEVIAADTRYVCNGATASVSSSGDGGNGSFTLFKVTSEAPGLHCPYGGERVDLGLDLDGDGVLEANEITQTTYACLIDTDAVGVHRGDLVLSSQDDVASLTGKRIQLGEILIKRSFTGAL
ncbi:MAG: hypothetical protein JST92_12110, partial [Deltaproteobacteria bacterium]|nr:hypothetical protein [Deltaproteobacteria bacterium]